jgi:lipopolysaccharide biosynthesis regulator YciM
MNVITLIQHAKLHEDRLNLHEERLKLHEERLNRHSKYCESIYKKINTFENDNLQKFIRKNTENTIQNIKIQEIIQKQKEQEKQIIELQEIIQKQKEQEKQIIELKKIIQEQKEPEKKIIELQNIIQEQKEPETQIIKSKEVITQEIPKKRNFDDVTNDYIERLTLTKKRSKPWSDGMSKYISITLVNDRWRWESSIFDENHINFKLKEDAEKYFETLIEKYNIDPIYITRIGYEDNKS